MQALQYEYMALPGYCQDERGIPDPFFSLDNIKEKKAVWPPKTTQAIVWKLEQ